MGLMLIMNIVVCKLHITNFLPKNGLKYVTTRLANTNCTNLVMLVRSSHTKCIDRIKVGQVET